MKITFAPISIPYFLTFILSVARFVQAQGTFIYDQQSSINPAAAGGGPVIQQIVPAYGQSFTPTFSSIGFVQLGLFDTNPGNGLGATVFLNLRSGSISGPVLGTTVSIFMPDGFGGTTAGVTNFFFAAEIGLTPGVAYYFQPVVQSGDLWGISAGAYNYSGGSVFVNGAPATGSDYWFREGIVPEPSSFALFLVGALAFTTNRRRSRDAANFGEPSCVSLSKQSPLSR